MIRNLTWLLLAGGSVFVLTLMVHYAYADAPVAPDKSKVYIVAARVTPPDCAGKTVGRCQPLYTRYNQHEPFRDKDVCEDFIAHDDTFLGSLPGLRAVVASQMPGGTVEPICYEADTPNPDSI